MTVRIVLLLVLLLGIAGCGAGAPATPALPSLVGLALSTAKSTAAAAGFTAVGSYDVAGSRSQFVDANWQVCSQDPAPGPVTAGTRVDLGVVRTEETCPGAAPATPSSVPTVAPTTAPITVEAIPTPTVDPLPAVPRQTVAPQRAVPAAPAPDTSSDSDAGGSGGPVVHPGAYCDPPGTGVTSKGTPMVCGPAKGGRNRWQKA